MKIGTIIIKMNDLVPIFRIYTLLILLNVQVQENKQGPLEVDFYLMALTAATQIASCNLSNLNTRIVYLHLLV